LPALDALRIARGLKEHTAAGAEWPGHGAWDFSQQTLGIEQAKT